MYLTRARWGFALIWFLFSTPGSTTWASDWTVKAGLGYEYLNQEYFLDSLSESGEDTLATVTALSTTYLDDLKGQVTLAFRPYEDRRLELRSSYEQTPHQLRLKFAADFRPRLGVGRVDGTWELDVRRSLDDSVAAGDEYVYGYTRTKYVLPIREHASLYWLARADFVDFDSPGAYAFDHYRAGASFGLTRDLGGFSSLDLSGFFIGRSVPDTNLLSYLSYGLEGSLFGYYDGGELDILTRFEVRDYNSFGETDDYLRLELDVRHRIDLGGIWFSRQELEGEGTWFDQPEELSGNYGRLRLTALTGIDKHTASVALGPRLERLWQDADVALAEDYAEWGVESRLDILAVPRLFGSVESILGRRDVRNEGGEDALRSDFTFERVNLLADLTVTTGLSLNGLLSAEWEWHEQSAENSRLMLISTGLSYSF